MRDWLTSSTLSGSTIHTVSHWVQGLGMTCKEELVWGDAEHSWLPRGHLQTRGPGKLQTELACYKMLYGVPCSCYSNTF